MDTVRAHQSRSAAYTSGGVPRSLFKTTWLCWMYQLYNMQHVVCVLVMVQHLRLAEVHCMVAV